MNCKEHQIVNINYKYVHIGLMSRVFANGPGDQDLIPGWIIPKTKKKKKKKKKGGGYLMPPCLTLSIKGKDQG